MTRTGFVAVTSDAVPIIDQLSDPVQIQYNLGEVPTMKLTFFAGVSAIKGTFLARRKVVKLIYDDASFSEWRITSLSREFSGDTDPSIACEPIWSDLGRRVIRRTLSSTGVVQLSISFFNMTATQALQRILSADLNVDPLFQLGTIASPFGSQTVAFTSNAMSHLEALSEICSQLNGGVGVEWEAVWNAGAGKYNINIVEQIGGGQSQAAQRPIEIGKAEGNRITMNRVFNDEELFSALVPMGGSDNEIFSISDNRFKVTLVVYDDGPNVTRIECEEQFLAPGWAAIVQGRYILVNGFSFLITAVDSNDNILVSGDVTPDVSVGDLFQLTSDNTGTEIGLLSNSTAVAEIGFVEIPYRRPDITPYPNLLDFASVSADLSNWNYRSGDGTISVDTSSANVVGTSANMITLVSVNDYLYTEDLVLIGRVDDVIDDELCVLQANSLVTYSGPWFVTSEPISPVGWERINGVEVITQEFAEEFVKYGISSAKVECGTGHGLQTKLISLAPNTSSPYFSFWIAIRVASGSIRLELVDSGAVAHPPSTDKATSNLDDTRSLSVGGTKPASGNARLRIVAESSGTVFYLDAVTLTQSSTPWEYVPLMGPTALLVESAKYLNRFGGLRPPQYSGEVWDPKFVNPAHLEITIGCYVRILDLYNPTTNTYEVDFVGRVASLTETENRLAGRIKKTISVTPVDNRKLQTVLAGEFVALSRTQSLPAIQSIRNLQVT